MRSHTTCIRIYLLNLLPGQIQARTGYHLRNRANIDQPGARVNLYANSFYPSTIRLWNDLPIETKSLPSIEAFKANHVRMRPQKNALYYYGGRLESAIHARLRLKNSPLKADLCNKMHVIKSPLCSCGSGKEEDAKHFLYDCQLFNPQRTVLCSNLLPYIVKRDDYDHLLYGIPEADHQTNLHIFEAVHQYIRDTKRFY